MLHFVRTNSEASQSSNSGCVGATPRVPKSLGLHQPLPKWCSQMRFAMTRAVSGFSADAIQFARSSRPLAVLSEIGAPPKTSSHRRGTTSPSFSGSPRSCNFVSDGLPSTTAKATSCFGADFVSSALDSVRARSLAAESSWASKGFRTSTAKRSTTQPTPSGPPGWASLMRPLMVTFPVIGPQPGNSHVAVLAGMHEQRSLGSLCPCRDVSV